VTTPLVVDLETTTPGPKPDMRVDEVTQVGWLPLDGDVAQWAECLCPLPEHSTIVCHNASYDVGILHREWSRVKGTINNPVHFGVLSRRRLQGFDVHDTLALAYAQGKQDLSLKGLGASELGVTTVPYAQRHLVGDEQYLAQDLFLTRDLLKKLLPLNHGTAYDIDRALIPALIDCSYRGYEADQERLEQAILDAESVCTQVKGAFHRMTEGVEVLQSRRKKTTKARGVEYVEKHGPPSIGSPTQLGRLLGLSDTEKDTLLTLVAGGGDQGIFADLILRWRKADKALDTYFYPIRGLDRLTGLFNITPNEDMEGGTGTGRLSSERKNMQNQPPALQWCLRAPEGYLLRRGDFPQIELRCCAEISDDPVMLEALSDPKRDLHQETADRLFHGDRQRAKVFNFKELYTAGPAVKVAYPRFYEWAQEHWAGVQRTSYSVSPEPFLHRRFIPLLAGEHARMAAINHPPQSMAVYICKVAMNRLFQDGALLVNQVHDEIHDYVPEDCDRDLTKRKMASIMEECMKEYLPRVGNAPVEVKISKYWE